jgi:hypothetical protein
MFLGGWLSQLSPVNTPDYNGYCFNKLCINLHVLTMPDIIPRRNLDIPAGCMESQMRTFRLPLQSLKNGFAARNRPSACPG